MSNRQSKYWCWTLNNPNPTEITTLQSLNNETLMLARRIGYLVCQEEAGENNTRHLQGYVEFKTAVKMRSVKNKLGLDRIHLEGRRGTQAQAIAYCKKTESRIEGGLSLEFGTPWMGKKDKFDNAVKAIKEGASIATILDEYPSQYAKYSEKLIDYKLTLLGKRTEPPKVVIYVGASGTGKSSTANTRYPDAYHAPWPVGGRWWWPFYQGEEVVILDEFRHQIKFDQMLKLLDRYPLKLEAKGRSFEFVSKRLVITTNIDPRDWYPGVKNAIDRRALERRIQEYANIYDFEEGHSHPNFVKTKRTERFTMNEPQEREQQSFALNREPRDDDDW